MSTPQKPTHFDGHYLRKRSILDKGVLGYIGIVWPKEHSPEVSHIPPVTPCIYIYIYNVFRQLRVQFEEDAADTRQRLLQVLAQNM